MPESLTAPARDALTAAVELAELLHTLVNDADADWPEHLDAIREYLRGIDRGAAVLSAVLDAHQAAAGKS